MLPVKASWNDSFSECGSIDSASPWLANLKVCACAAGASVVPAAKSTPESRTDSTGRHRNSRRVFMGPPGEVSVVAARQAELDQRREERGAERNDGVVEIISAVVQ